MLTSADFVTALRRDGSALIAAAEHDLASRVPSCPGWSEADLVRHTGHVHRHKLAIIEAGGTERPDIDMDHAGGPAETDLPGWYREGLEALAERLEATDPETPAYSWAGDHRVGFWHRRMAQETLVHRCDAEYGVGITPDVDPALAADGIDEYLRIFVPDPDLPPAGPTGTLALRATDVDRDWWVDTRDWPPTIRDGHAGADADVRGTAEQLLLVLWRRLPVSKVAVTGRAGVFRSLHDAVDLG